jgi:SAM-dependent methyltransferase
LKASLGRPADLSLATSVTPPAKQNWMHPIRWVPAGAASLLDIGCNAGELLAYCHELYPAMRLAGVEINSAALAKARHNLPDAQLHGAGADALPFADASFECVTCIEVLEHIPARLRQQALSEMRRVLQPGGRLVLRVPHAGWFAFLDSNNLRFRVPRLYRTLLQNGRRDAGYAGGSADVVWHHHFSEAELRELLGAGWELETSRTGGLLMFPLSDIALWPFYRLQRTNNVFYRALHRLADFDIGCDYGRASFDILLVLKRI